MAGLEVAAISLGAAVVKSACKLWLGDRQFTSDVTSDLVDALAGHTAGWFDQRRITRFFDNCTDIVAKRLVVLLDTEFRNVPDNERDAAVLAVRDTFARGRLTDEALFDADLDARLVERQLRPAATLVLSKAFLSQDGEQVFWLVLRESCTYLVEAVTTLPKFQSGAITELLRRETAVLSTLSRVLDRLPERRGVDDFAADYCRAVANKLDRMELLGVTLADTNRRYPLSIAYIFPSMLWQPCGSGRLMIRGEPETADQFSSSGGLRTEGVLEKGRRALVVGPAGSGKTTLLQWLAVRSARRDFSGLLSGWNELIPFFIPLRRYVNRNLPTPEEFPLTVGAHLAHEMPSGWVHELLRAGKALVLVDGVDEMPEGQRGRVRAWLSDLRDSFNAARYVVTSRPAAIEEGWLDRLGFATTELQPMSASDVSEFVHQWHEAVMIELSDADERNNMVGYERSLLAAIDTDRHLRALTVNPLLCALLCALNRERRTQLPHDRMEIYSAALDMLIDRRDRERGVGLEEITLTRTEKILLLQDIAFWLVRNGWSDASIDRVTAQVGRSIMQLHSIGADQSYVFRSLLERSGVLREPAVGCVDFVHRTFQEYLAGKAAVENDEIGQLIANAHNDQWREVVVMAAGHAQPDQCAELIQGLLKRGRRRAHRSRLRSLAVACMQTARRIDPRLRAQIAKVAEQLVPPTTNDAAEDLAGAGQMLIDLLRAKPPRSAEEAAASIRAVAKIGGQDAMQLIAEIAASYSESVSSRLESEIINAWRFFKPDQYVQEVFAHSWPSERTLWVPDFTYIESLQLFPELSALGCNLMNPRTGMSNRDLTPIARNRKLHKVSLRECDEDLDLTPLLGVPLLDDLTLACQECPPELTALSSISRPWALTLECHFYTGPLPAIDQLQTLTSLSLNGFDGISELSVLPPRPQSLRGLSLYSFAHLRSLSGITRWDGLKTVEFFECRQLTDLSELAEVKSIEQLSLGLFAMNETDLRPLAELPKLTKLSLLGHSAFDLSVLAGKQNIVITVPVGARVSGVEKLGAGSTIAESQFPFSVMAE